MGSGCSSPAASRYYVGTADDNPSINNKRVQKRTIGISRGIESNKTTSSGVVGLRNLGNTCFMNSALQCLSNTIPLSNFFMTYKWKQEINLHNPLGMQGQLAEAYGGLISSLWCAPHKTAVDPKAFLSQLAKFAPHFSGNLQHDSQELLAFLLDGLHEDLNRVKTKPSSQDAYGEEGCLPDEVVSATSWRQHLQRNKSIIVDLFQGQLKSSLTCLTCGHSSVKFDPFMYLSLPMPKPKPMPKPMPKPKPKPKPMPSREPRPIPTTTPPPTTTTALTTATVAVAAGQGGATEPVSISVADSDGDGDHGDGHGNGQGRGNYISIRGGSSRLGREGGSSRLGREGGSSRLGREGGSSRLGREGGSSTSTCKGEGDSGGEGEGDSGGEGEGDSGGEGEGDSGGEGEGDEKSYATVRGGVGGVGGGG